MGGKPAPSAPTVVMPAPTAPQTYVSTTPLQSYRDLGEQLQRIQQETAKITEQRYREVGTPAELGARAAARRQTELAAYLASLPSGDTYLTQTTGKSDKYKPAREATEKSLTEAQKEYAEALKKIGEIPTTTVTKDLPDLYTKSVYS